MTKDQSGSAAEFSQARRPCDGRSWNAEKGYKLCLLTTVILISAIPDDMALFEAAQNAANVIALDRAGKAFNPSAGHQGFKQRIGISPIHDIHINVAAKRSTTKIQSR